MLQSFFFFFEAAAVHMVSLIWIQTNSRERFSVEQRGRNASFGEWGGGGGGGGGGRWS